MCAYKVHFFEAYHTQLKDCWYCILPLSSMRPCDSLTSSMNYESNQITLKRSIMTCRLSLVPPVVRPFPFYCGQSLRGHSFSELQTSLVTLPMPLACSL